jgi:hypothetical protein
MPGLDANLHVASGGWYQNPTHAGLGTVEVLPFRAAWASSMHWNARRAWPAHAGRPKAAHARAVAPHVAGSSPSLRHSCLSFSWDSRHSHWGHGCVRLRSSALLGSGATRAKYDRSAQSLSLCSQTSAHSTFSGSRLQRSATKHWGHGCVAGWLVVPVLGSRATCAKCDSSAHPGYVCAQTLAHSAFSGSRVQRAIAVVSAGDPDAPLRWGHLLPMGIGL